MNEEKNIWNEIFRREGRVFEEPNPLVLRFAAILKEGNGSRVLDLGCGSGRHVVTLAAQGFSVYGLDRSGQGLRMTRDWLAGRGLTAGLHQQDMYEPFPYPDESFDGVFSIQVIHHGLLREVQRAAAEVVRVLKPGGLLLVTVPVAQKGRSGHSIEVEPMTFVPQEGFEKGLPHHIFSAEGLRELFAGCEVLDQHPDGEKHQALWARKRLESG